jgi:hypothetical protein
MIGKDCCLPMASISLEGAVRATFIAAEKLREEMEANIFANRDVLKVSGANVEVGGMLKRLDGK